MPVGKFVDFPMLQLTKMAKSGSNSSEFTEQYYALLKLKYQIHEKSKKSVI